MKKTNKQDINRLLTGINSAVIVMIVMILFVPAISKNLFATTIGTSISTSDMTSSGNLSVTGSSTLTGAVNAGNNLSVSGTTTMNGTADMNGLVTIGDGGETVAIESSDWDINATGDMTGIGTITSNGNFLTTGSVTMGATPELVIPESGWVAAGETWTYASADNPTFTLTISGDKTSKYSAGMRVKLTQPTDGAKYFIITKVAFSSPNTTLTVFAEMNTSTPTQALYGLDNEAISSPFYSTMKAPAGFPLDPIKWTVTVTDTEWRTQASPAVNTWYNLGSISINIPVGTWYVSHRELAGVDKSVAAYLTVLTVLSTGNNNNSDIDFMTFHTDSTSTGHGTYSTNHVMKPLILSSKTTYYLNISADQAGFSNLYLRGDIFKTKIEAVSAYL